MTIRVPEDVARDATALCSGCGQCIEQLADSPCLYFPRLSALQERGRRGGADPSSRELSELIDLCNGCGLCPCADVRVKIREAKDAFVARDGLGYGVRLLEDVPKLAALCGVLPALTNRVLGFEPLARLAKRTIGVHPDRLVPPVPARPFDDWAARHGLDRRCDEAEHRVAYFVGCTARWFYPEIAIATVEVLKANGIAVWVPPQTCCGMPPHLEGDRDLTFERVSENIDALSIAIESGYDVVTACPTCSFMFKSVLARGAQFAEDRRRRIEDLAEELGRDAEAIHRRLAEEDLAPTGRANAAADAFHEPWVINQILGRRYSGEASDAGYFADIDPEVRIRIAGHVFELGEYLQILDREGRLRRDVVLPETAATYYPPCHLREQGIGMPWRELLADVGGRDLPILGDGDDCCGLGGVMGLKAGFHDTSVAMGARLMDKARAAAPERVVTECLGCRMQFRQLTDFPVVHPVECLAEAYRRRNREKIEGSG
jgi:glycerol-3-phosphate dehydrogenase subunit C